VFPSSNPRTVRSAVVEISRQIDTFRRDELEFWKTGWKIEVRRRRAVAESGGTTAASRRFVAAALRADGVGGGGTPNTFDLCGDSESAGVKIRRPQSTHNGSAIRS
jgi:hypothetical protein